MSLVMLLVAKQTILRTQFPGAENMWQKLHARHFPVDEKFLLLEVASEKYVIDSTWGTAYCKPLIFNVIFKSKKDVGICP